MAGKTLQAKRGYNRNGSCQNLSPVQVDLVDKGNANGRKEPGNQRYERTDPPHPVDFMVIFIKDPVTLCPLYLHTLCTLFTHTTAPPSLCEYPCLGQRDARHHGQKQGKGH